MNSQAAQTMPERRTFTDAEIREWMERHDLESMSLTDARAAVEDAQSMDMLAAAPAASGGDGEMCPNCVTPWKCNGPHESTGGASVSERARDKRFTAMLIGIIADVQDELGFTDEDKECSNGSLEIVAAIRELKEQALTQPLEISGDQVVLVGYKNAAGEDCSAFLTASRIGQLLALTQQRGEPFAWAMTDHQADGPMTILTTNREDAKFWGEQGIDVEPLYKAPQPSADAVREVPDGMVLVPREPTEAMIDAWTVCNGGPADCYRAMLSAASGEGVG